MRVFFIKELAEGAFIDLIDDAGGDEVVQELILQVKNDANITIKGRVVDSAELLPLSVINQNGLAVANSIESAGLYIVPVEGMSGVEISAEGSVSVVVKAIG